VVEAGLTSLPSSERCDTHASHFSSSNSKGLPHCYDVLLHRVKAQLLLALSSANEALAVLGSARQRLSAARRALGSRQDVAAAVALLRVQEAQVRHCMLLCHVASHTLQCHADSCSDSVLGDRVECFATMTAVVRILAQCKPTAGGNTLTQS
jgi:hypothetical protein